MHYAGFKTGDQVNVLHCLTSDQDEQVLKSFILEVDGNGMTLLKSDLPPGAVVTYTFSSVWQLHAR